MIINKYLLFARFHSFFVHEYLFFTFRECIYYLSHENDTWRAQTDTHAHTPNSRVFDRVH